MPAIRVASLWKHRGVLRERRPAGLALVGIPQAWLFQIGLALISPLIDLALGVSIIATIVRVQQHGYAAGDQLPLPRPCCGWDKHKRHQKRAGALIATPQWCEIRGSLEYGNV